MRNVTGKLNEVQSSEEVSCWENHVFKLELLFSFERGTCFDASIVAYCP